MLRASFTPMCYVRERVFQPKRLKVGIIVLGLVLAIPVAPALASLLSSNLFLADNPWNQNISQAPVATNSAAIINSITNAYGNGRFHPDFGQDYQLATDPLYGIPYNVVHGNSTSKIQVVIDAYPGESDLQNAPVPT